ncbi:unnamed protein product, partial [Adineta steineri]
METADTSRIIWGHTSFEDTSACAAGVSACRCSSLVRGEPGTVWPCWSRRDASTITDDLVSITPTLSGNVETGHGITGPMVFLGYKVGEPVYRTTMALATALPGEDAGSYQLHEPALFPKVLIVECGLTQVDVTIRTGFSSPLGSAVTHNFHPIQESDGSSVTSCNERGWGSSIDGQESE